MGMIMHDDVPYGEGTSYTQGTGIAINNNVIAVDADNSPTENSEKPVKSKGVYEVVEQIYADNGVLGAKNRFNSNALKEKTTDTVFTKTDTGIRVTNISAGTWKYVSFWLTNLPKNTEFEISLDASIISGKAKVVVRDFNTQTSLFDVNVSDGERLTRQFNTGNYSSLYLVMYSSTGTSESGDITYNDILLKLASDPDDTYVPYAMTNRELTEELTLQESAVTDIVEGASVGLDYGNHLIKKGNIVQLSLRLKGVTAQQWATVICRIPEGYRPKYRTAFRDVNAGKYLYCMTSGIIQSGTPDFSNTELLISTTWITD